MENHESAKDKKKVICTLTWNVHAFDIDVEFIGGHFRKSVLLKLVRAIKLQYRKQVKLYRHDLILGKAKEQFKLEGETKNDTGTNRSSESSEDSTRESREQREGESISNTSSSNGRDSKSVSRFEQIRCRNEAEGSREGSSVESSERTGTD